MIGMMIGDCEKTQKYCRLCINQLINCYNSPAMKVAKIAEIL